ncbi:MULTISPECIES: sensor histidine kinase [Sphingobacterium]|uniref:sensor histidine kinase n=1 Tax=Sphingobacterium TaxID=28453 RepID=UPI00257CB801|nr:MULTISPECIES: sensor histidine kinase [Sphingobacterium]
MDKSAYSTSKRILGQKQISILIHGLAWLIFLSFPVLFFNNGQLEIKEILFAPAFWIFTGCFLILFYVNAYVLIPYSIKHRKFISYGISIILTGLLLACYLQPFDRLMRIVRQQLPTPGDREFSPRHHPDFPPPPSARHFPYRGPGQSPGQRPQPIDIASVYIFLLTISLAALYRIVTYWMETQQKMQLVEQDRMKAELSFLKAQVHPHFLFNTLNNIYALALTNDDAVASSIHRLSQLMRYYMDERHSDTIDIKIEIQAIQDFINLQKLRIGPNCSISEHYTGLEHPKTIHAFVLLPFVENAFKYGLSTIEPCQLSFEVILTPTSCTLNVKNSIATQSTEQHRTGTGLKNVQRLLEHFYADRHRLTIQQEDHSFFVQLILYISP